MSIFDDIQRSHQTPRPESESAFAYLNRSSRIEADRVRRLVDRWINHYPTQHREPLIARFRSKNDDHHLSAFFELFLHELLLRCGHRVLAFEPRLSYTRHAPDLLIESSHGDRFYFEGMLSTVHSQHETAARTRLNQAIAAIDSMPSPAHFLDPEITGSPTAPIEIWKLKRGLHLWISRLSEDESVADALPFRYEENGACIIVRAWRRRRPQEVNSVDARHFRAMTIVPDGDIWTTLKNRASKYGKLDYPYVVAVNAFGNFQREGNAIDALLGPQRTPFRTSSKEKHGNKGDDRSPYGIWVGPRGPRNTKLSAVISVEGVDPWSFAQRSARLIHNPWATKQLSKIDLGVSALKLVGGQLCRYDGRSIASILGVSQRWPETE
jgi:hypothetical protein